MPDPRAWRQARQDLVDRLTHEYAGSVPAGQVLATVLRVDRVLQACQPDPCRRIALCEELVRGRFRGRLAAIHLVAVAS